MKKIMFLMFVALGLSADLKTVDLVKGVPQTIGSAGDVMAVQPATRENIYITHGSCAYDASKAMLLEANGKIISLGTLSAEVCAFTTSKKAKLKVQKD